MAAAELTRGCRLCAQGGEGIGESVDEPDGPGKRGDESDGDVVPEGLLVAIEVGAEAGEIVLEEEDAEELRRAELDEHIPGSGDGEEDGESDGIEGADEGARVSLGGAEGDKDERGKGGRNGSLGEHGKGVEGVKEHEPEAAGGGDWLAARASSHIRQESGGCGPTVFGADVWADWARIRLIPAEPGEQGEAKGAARSMSVAAARAKPRMSTEEATMRAASRRAA